MASCVEDCVLALEAAGIEAEQMHAESGAQQYEISTGPLPVMAAVDTLIQSQEIVKIVSESHGYRATFLPVLPKPLPDLGSSGMHVHISMHKEARASSASGSQEENASRWQGARRRFSRWHFAPLAGSGRYGYAKYQQLLASRVRETRTVGFMGHAQQVYPGEGHFCKPLGAQDSRCHRQHVSYCGSVYCGWAGRDPRTEIAAAG